MESDSLVSNAAVWNICPRHTSDTAA